MSMFRVLVHGNLKPEYTSCPVKQNYQNMIQMPWNRLNEDSNNNGRKRSIENTNSTLSNSTMMNQALFLIVLNATESYDAFIEVSLQTNLNSNETVMH